MTCTPTPTPASGIVTCTGTVGTGAGQITTPDNTVTVTDTNGNINTMATTGLILDQNAPTPPTINPVDENSTEVTGTAEPGSEINISPVTCDNASVFADTAGNWTCDVTNSAPLTVGSQITATATDASGNESAPATTTVAGAGTQLPPTINPTDGTLITGTGEPGDTITVTDDMGNPVCTAVVAANGTWSCTPTTPPAPGTVLEATATDPTTGQVSTPATTIVSGTGQLLPPQVDPTNGTVVTGTTVPNGTINIIDPNTGTVLCTTVADSVGNYSCAPLTPMPNSGDPLNVTVSLNGETSAPTVVIVDGLPPTPPTINPYTEGETTVTGSAEPGNIIDLSPLVCTNAPVVVDSLGNWSCIPATTLVAGDIITATATDPAGNTSGPASMPVTGVGGVVPPTVYPTDGSNVSGTGISGATVSVMDPSGNVLCTALVDDNGLWSCVPSPMPNTGDVLQVNQTDPAGNTSANVPVTVLDPSMVASPPPTIEPTEGAIIDGGGIPGDTIIVKDDQGNVVCTAQVDLNGNWSCAPTVNLVAGDLLFATAIDPITGSSSLPAQGIVTIFFNPIGVRTALDGGAGGAINGLWLLVLVWLLGRRFNRLFYRTPTQSVDKVVFNG